MTPQRVTIRKGFDVEYVEHGDPSGVPMVLLHGFTDSWQSFEPLLPHLPASIRAFAFSQRGHGDTDRPSSGYAVTDFAADVVGFMDAMHLGAAVIAGHSMGAAVAERVAIEYPDRVLALSLMGAFAGFGSNISELEREVLALSDPVDPAFVRAFQESTVARPVPPAFMDTVVHQSLKVPARVWRATLRGLLDGEVGVRRSRVAAPTLIVWGDLDTFCLRSDQDALLNEIPRSTLSVYQGASHAVHWEEPVGVAGDLASFVARCKLSSTATVAGAIEVV